MYNKINKLLNTMFSVHFTGSDIIFVFSAPKIEFVHPTDFEDKVSFPSCTVANITVSLMSLDNFHS